MNRPITRFDAAHRFLSNFFIEPDGTSVEVEFQVEKCAIPADRKRFIGLSPVAAKRLGGKIKLRSGWDSGKLSLMAELVRNKFTDHVDLAWMLVGTGDAELIHGVWWDDEFWGVRNGKGENHLGKMLMQVRAELSIAVEETGKQNGEDK